MRRGGRGRALSAGRGRPLRPGICGMCAGALAAFVIDAGGRHGHAQYDRGERNVSDHKMPPRASGYLVVVYYRPSIRLSFPSRHGQQIPERNCDILPRASAMPAVAAELLPSPHIPGHHAGRILRRTSMAHDALRTILPVAGWPEERASAVEITGGTDPILPTPFRIGETAPPPRRDRAGRLRSLGAAHRAAPGCRGRRAPGDRLAPQQPLPPDGRAPRLAPSATRSWASTRRRTAAGATSTAISRTTARPPSACSACRRTARPCARRSRSGTPWSSRRRSSPPRAPAAWSARWTSGRSIPRRRRSPRCR